MPYDAGHGGAIPPAGNRISLVQVAWGQSFPFAVADGLAKSHEERYQIGLNRSAIHTDVVIGGEGLTVTGTAPAGTIEIIRDDEWVLGI